MAEDSGSHVRPAETEISNGISPWLSRVRQNERSEANPYMVGFYQDDGKIRTLYGERLFRSKRQIEAVPFAGRIDEKEVNLLDTQFQIVASPTIMKSKHWEVLPEDLRQRFESGEILITGSKDIYGSTDTDKSNVSQSIQQSQPGYHLLYYSDFGSAETGRTGVLMESVNGEVKPVIATIDGREFVVEIKGCGTKVGGFGKMHYRTGRDILTGATEKEQAENEFARLNETDQADMPKAAGSILFENNGYQQGYIIRLTPSTVRASYTGNDVYPDIESSDNVKQIVKMYSQELVNQIYAPNPKILDRSSHSENILIWGNGQATFTDFSDHVSFNDSNYPHEETSGGYMTPKRMLEHYINMVREIPGYNETRDQQFFYDLLSKAFRQKGHDLALNPDDDEKGVTEKIWEQGGMAYQVYKARRESNFVAEGALHELEDKIHGSSGSNKLGLDSEAAFVGKYQRALVDIPKILTDLSEYVNTEDQKTIQQALMVVSQGDFLSDFATLDKVFGIAMQLPLPAELRSQISSVLVDYVANLANTFAPIGDYINHEADVMTAAKVTCPDNERVALDHAHQEAQKKQHAVKRIVRSPYDLYKLLTDTEEARKMITFSSYTSK